MATVLLTTSRAFSRDRGSAMRSCVSIAGELPETGFRIRLEREPSEAAPWRYTGELRTASSNLGVTAVMSAAGEIEVSLELLPGGPDAADGALDRGLGEKVRLLLRAIYKNTCAEEPGSAPPRPVKT